MPTRRDTLIATAASVMALFAPPIRAQPQKVWKVGILTSVAKLPSGECLSAPRTTPGSFAATMDQLGLIEGRDVVYIRRCADGDPKRYPALASELVQANPDVIFAAGWDDVAVAVKRATNRIPIVMIHGPDPVAQGWTNSYGRPSGNLTGFTGEISENDALLKKAYELIVEAIPGVRRIAHLERADHPLVQTYNVQRKQASDRLNVDIPVVGISSRHDIEGAFRRIRNIKADAVLLSGLYVYDAQQAVGEALARSRLPVLNIGPQLFFPGALLAFAPDVRDHPERAAEYVARILRGAKVSELPFQRPVKTRTVVDLKVARRLGLTIPPSVLLRADEIVE